MAQLKYAWTTHTLCVGIALLSATTTQAADRPTDSQLGLQWASCAEEAKILGEHARTERARAVLRKAAALFGAYAVASSGRADADSTRGEVRRSLDAELISRSTDADRGLFVSRWSTGAEQRAEVCRQSFALYGPRFKSKVGALVEEDRTQ